MLTLEQKIVYFQKHLLDNSIECCMKDEIYLYFFELENSDFNFLEKLNFSRVGDDYLIKNLSIRKKKEKKLVLLAFFSFGLNILLASMKIIFGKIFFSSSLLADGFNSFTDSITNFLVIIGLKVGNKTEDKNHPFGYGKLESVFSVIIGALL